LLQSLNRDRIVAINTGCLVDERTLCAGRSARLAIELVINTARLTRLNHMRLIIQTPRRLQTACRLKRGGEAWRTAEARTPDLRVANEPGKRAYLVARSRRTRSELGEIGDLREHVILEIPVQIERYLQGLTFEQFHSDEKTIDAVVQNLEVIGEAVRHLSTA
jgi:hypothetical protein